MNYKMTGFYENCELNIMESISAGRFFINFYRAGLISR